VPGVVLAVAGLCLLLRDPPLSYGLLSASVALGLAGFAWAQASYRALGHAVDDRVVTARHGVLERRTQTVDRRAPIGLRVRQSVFARRAGVASMDVALVSRGYTRICDMAAGDVDELARTLLPGWSPPPPPGRRDHGNGGQN
jgi:putative membrane protein